MRPGVNHIERKGGITEYRWRYYERKIGVYLDLHTPLVAGPDGKTGFTSRLTWEPRGRLLAGCAEWGEFRPLVDWVVENSPETIARLFTEPGAL